MSEYDALLQEADAMVAADGEALSGRTVYDGMPESHPTMRLIRLRDNRAALAAALRASEARADRFEMIALAKDGCWRCFHCNEVFQDAFKAGEHFGPTLYAWHEMKARVDSYDDAQETIRLLREERSRTLARAEAAEKRERAYREALLDLGRDCCAEAECENPWTHKSLREYGYGHYRCPEHAPEAKGGE